MPQQETWHQFTSQKPQLAISWRAFSISIQFFFHKKCWVVFHKRSSDLMSNLNKMTVPDLHIQCWTINPNPVSFTVFTQVPLGVWDGALGHAPSVPGNCLGLFSPLGPFRNFHSSGSSMEWMFVTPPKFTCWNLIPTMTVTEGGAVWRMIRLGG